MSREPIPVRLWTGPQTYALGYLEFGTPETDGDTVRYTMTFREAVLDEPPRHDVRLVPASGEADS